MEHRILVVEDQKDIADLIAMHVRDLGHRVDCVHDGNAGLKAAQSGDYSMVVLDVMLPGRDGLDVVKTLRMERNATPVLMLTARSTEIDRVLGLELGADDYLTKPFGLSELLARIRAVLRRTQVGAKAGVGDKQSVGGVMKFPDLVVDWRRFTILRDGTEQQLSRYEAEILRMLVERRGEVVSRQDLLRKVWGYVHLPTTRTVDNHIARLRKKLERDVDKPIHVVTVHGLGYRFESPLLEES